MYVSRMMVCNILVYLHEPTKQWKKTLTETDKMLMSHILGDVHTTSIVSSLSGWGPGYTFGIYVALICSQPTPAY